MITIGLDISKDTIDLCTYQNKEKYEFYKFDNTDEGHKNIVNFLKKHYVKLVVCEPTGGYEFEIFKHLGTRF